MGNTLKKERTSRSPTHRFPQTLMKVTFRRSTFTIHMVNHCFLTTPKDVKNKSRSFSNNSLCRLKNSLSYFSDKGRQGCKTRRRQSTPVGILEYSSRNTPVLLWQYSSTAPRVLEYFRESTAVLPRKYCIRLKPRRHLPQRQAKSSRSASENHGNQTWVPSLET